MQIVFSISDEEIRKRAKALKQLDIEQAKQVRQHFNKTHAEIPITRLEELESKPLEEYEKDIRERFSQLFRPESSR